MRTNSKLTGRENLHTVFCYGHPLGVICRICDQRALVSLEALSARRHDLTPIADLPLKCSLCGSRRYSPVLFDSEAEVAAFLPERLDPSF